MSKANLSRGGKRVQQTMRFATVASLILAAALVEAQKGRVVKVYVAGSQVHFDRVTPQHAGRRILVPLRGIFEKMGATVHYIPSQRKVIAKRDGKTVELTLNRRFAYVNGHTKMMDAYSRVSKGHVLVPIRFVAESLDAGVAYSAPDYTVRINPH